MKNVDFLKNRLIAHRGIFDNKKVPENSIKAFMDAINKRYAIELDVHLTKDKRIVVFHDDVLDRMTNEKGFIKDYTYEKLRKIKLLNTNYTIPSLDEVLKLVDGKVPLLIELKYDVKHHKLEKELIKILDNYSGKFAVQSFDPFIISFFRFHKNNYIRGLLVSPKKDTLFKKISNSMIFIPLCNPDFLSVYKKMSEDIKVIRFKKHKPVLAWTMRSKEDVDNYKDKFDNIICNIKDC